MIEPCHTVWSLCLSDVYSQKQKCQGSFHENRISERCLVRIRLRGCRCLFLVRALTTVKGPYPEKEHFQETCHCLLEKERPRLKLDLSKYQWGKQMNSGPAQNLLMNELIYSLIH